MVSTMIAAALGSDHVILLILTIFMVFVAYRLRQPNRLPHDLPWAGGSSSSFGKLLAPYRAVFSAREFMEEAYHKFGKLNRSCIMPNIFGNRIVIPSSYMDWVVRQSAQNLSAEATQDLIQAKYTLRFKSTERKPVPIEFIQRQLKQHIDELTADLMDEISFSMDELLGFDTNRYKTVNLYKTFGRVVIQTLNRVLVGQPLCRDAEYLATTSRYIDAVTPVAYLIRLFPSFLIPAIGKQLSLVNSFFYRKCARSLSPLILERITRWHANADVKHNDPPNNWISWAVEEAMKRETYKTVDKKVHWVSRSMMNVQFAATHTTKLSTSHFILNVFSAPAEQHCASDLLTECETLDNKFGAEWNRARLTEMRTMDSALRESLRLSSLITTSQTRKVLSPDGLILPNDTWLPRGSLVEMAAYSVHHDESIYAEASKYRHTRFMQSSTDGTSPKSPSTTEPTFLAWGHGRHACPGRFLAVDVMKLIMTYLITNYEVMPLLETSKSKWVMDHMVPPLDATIEIRRRAETVKQ